MTKEAAERHDYEVTDLYGDSLRPPEVLVYPTTPEEVDEFLDWLGILKQQSGTHIAIVDGAYDVPHSGHEWYLRDCRLRATQRAVIAQGGNWDLLTADERLDLVASDLVTLLVTVDADERVRATKSTPAKGGITRPVYSWQSRAERVMGYMIPNASLVYRPVVDIATVEGDMGHIGTALESHFTFAAALQQRQLLDSWVFWGEHEDKIELARQYGIDPIVIPVDVSYGEDPMTGQSWSSSAIIRRVRGETSTTS